MLSTVSASALAAYRSVHSFVSVMLWVTLISSRPGKPISPSHDTREKVTEASLRCTTDHTRRSYPTQPPCSVSKPFSFSGRW